MCFFVGRQADGPLDERSSAFGSHRGYAEFDGQRYDIRAQVHTIGGYSAHADQIGLMRFITGMRKWPDEVRIAHEGEPAKRELAQSLQSLSERNGYFIKVIIP